MGIAQTLVTVGGVLAIIGLLALLFCHYLGGWTRTKAWLRSSGEEKMVLTRAGTHRHFNPNGYMVSSESDLNISGRGSFRRFDTTDLDYQLFRQGSSTSLTRHHNYHQRQLHNQQGQNSTSSSLSSIPPQPLRPAPIPPSPAQALVSGRQHLNSQSSLDSVFNTAPSSPAFQSGVQVPRIPPPPSQQQHQPHSVTSSVSYASQKQYNYANMGDGNHQDNKYQVGSTPSSGGNHFSGESEGSVTGSTTTTTYSSTNPFLPLLQASSNFFTQTIQSFQSGLQQQPQNVNSAMASTTTTVGAGGEGIRGESNGSSSTAFATNLQKKESFDESSSGPKSFSSPFASVSSSISTIPGSAGLSMGEILFSAPPSHQSSNLETARTNPLTTHEIFTTKRTPFPETITSSAAATEAPCSSIFSTSNPNHLKSREVQGSSSLVGSSGNHRSNSMSSASSSGSPQHARYNLHHQSSAENVISSSSSNAHGSTSSGTGILSHSPPSGTSAIRRASYPNRKEYTVHDTIPKSEFPQHIPYIPSLHHHHHGKSGVGGTTGSGTEGGGVTGGSNGGGTFNDPLRHHHHIHHHHLHHPVQPFLEEQEEPPEEPCSNHQLTQPTGKELDSEKEDLTNRIMLETMREEIRLANKCIGEATKSLMMDDVFLPTTSTATANPSTTAITQQGNNSDGGNHLPLQHRESPRKRTFSVSGNFMQPTSYSFSASTENEMSSISGKEAGEKIAENVGISALALNSSGGIAHHHLLDRGNVAGGEKGGMLRRSSTPNTSKTCLSTATFNSSYSSSLTQSTSSSTSSTRPTTLIQQPICVNTSSNINKSNETESETKKSNGRTSILERRRNSREREEMHRNYVPPVPVVDNTGENGQRNEKAVSSSSITTAANNIIELTAAAASTTTAQLPPTSSNSSGVAIPSGYQPCREPTGTKNEPSQTSSLPNRRENNSNKENNVSALLSSIANVMSSNNGSGISSVTTASRPPSVSSYFRQNSRSFSLRQSSTDSIGSDISDLSSPTEGSLPSLQRAMSCDSVCSDTSVILGELDPPHMTGHLCIGLEYDSETADLLVNVMEAKELVGPDPDPNAPFDSYVRVYLLPDKTTNMQTRVYRKSLCPSYKEKFMFGLEMSELASRSLVFYLYATDKYTNTLIGEAELRLGDIDFCQPIVTWLLLTDTGQRGGEFGEIMFSLSYLPTAERLTVVVVKARNLKFPHERETGDPFVKVYLLQRGKKVSKKKSSTKRGERNPIFNEAMIFSIPAHALQTIQLRITVADSLEAEGRAYSIGHVIVGSAATGKPLSHWNQMLSSLRKPIAMWHALRK